MRFIGGLEMVLAEDNDDDPVSPRATGRRGHGNSGASSGRKHRCQICSRPFDRKDTLNRHLQIHDKNRPPPIPRKKSCGSCFKSKIKCSGDYPSCKACLKRGVHCVYDNHSVQRKFSNQSQPQLPSSSSLSPFPAETDMSFNEGVHCEQTNGNGLLSPQSSLEMPGVEPESAALYSAMDLSGNPNSSTTQDSLLTGKFGFESFVYSDLSDCIQNSSLDWMFRNALDDNFSFSFPNTPGNDLMMAETMTNIPEISHQDDGKERNLQDWHQESQQVMEQLGNPSIRPRNRCDPDDPWPMEWYAESLQNSELPMLGRIDEVSGNTSSYFAMDPISTATREKMMGSVRLALERTFWPLINLGNFPSEEKLDHCVDLYFAHFHRTFPIIHRPTFDTAKDPVVVTLALACIGACYTAFEGARSFANALSELNRRLLLFMSEQDRRSVRTEFFLIAQLLQGTHGYCCGNKRLFELSDAFRSSVVSNARCMGLFEDRPPTAPVDDSPTARWHAWIADERIRRLAWAVYEYDSQVSYLHNTRPYLSVSEMKLALPSSLALWEAESAHVWMSLHPWTDSVPQTLPFRSTIGALFEQPDAGMGKVTDDQHQLIVVLTLTRMLWSVKEFQASPINDFVRETDSLQESKRHIKEVVDRFLVIQAPTTKTALSSFVRRSQVIHMAHLYGAGDLMDWIRPLLRGGREAEGARKHIAAWGAEDAIRVRSTAYHSAQTLAIVRRFPHNEPLEAYNVFHAGVVLWCVAGLLSESRGALSGGANFERRKVGYRIDATTRGGDSCAQSQADFDWIQHGGDYPVGLHGVPDLCCARGQMQVLEQIAEILERMQVWGIAQNFLLVILQMVQREEERRNGRI